MATSYFNWPTKTKEQSARKRLMQKREKKRRKHLIKVWTLQFDKYVPKKYKLKLKMDMVIPLFKVFIEFALAVWYFLMLLGGHYSTTSKPYYGMDRFTPFSTVDNYLFFSKKTRLTRD